VHGLAGTIGGLKHIPHGVICSRLMWPTNAITVRRLKSGREGSAALSKYIEVGKLFCSVPGRPDDFYIDYLLNTIREWTAALKIPGLRSFGVSNEDIEQFARLSDNKNNPVNLNYEDRLELLEGAG
jgi:alcohol dehydrogenase class IV